MLTGMRVLPRAASPLIAASRVSVRLLLSRVPLNWKNAPPVLHWETVAPVASRVERSPYRSAREREMRILVLLSCRVESTAGTAQARPAQADAAVSSQRSADLPPCASLPSPSPALQALRCSEGPVGAAQQRMPPLHLAPPSPCHCLSPHLLEARGCWQSQPAAR